MKKLKISSKREIEFIKLQEMLEYELEDYGDYAKNKVLGALCQAWNIIVNGEKFKPLD